MVKSIINVFDHMELCFVINLTKDGNWAITPPPIFATGYVSFATTFLARQDEVQEELLYYSGVGVGGGGGVSKKFNVKVFYVIGKALSGELSCPCDRSCYTR